MKRTLGDRIYLSLATLFGLGNVSLCPGTVACFPAVIAFIFIKSRIYFFLFTLISLIVAFLVSGRAEDLFGEKDCKKIVIDDFAGMLITFLFIPHNIDVIFIPAAFFLFRMLDMLKIPPANEFEKFKGAKGIVGDDLIAGIYSCGILHFVRLLLNITS